MSSFSTIDGRVMDERSGLGCAHALISVTAAGSTVASGRCDVDGRFSLAVSCSALHEAGEGTITARPTGVARTLNEDGEDESRPDTVTLCADALFELTHELVVVGTPAPKQWTGWAFLAALVVMLAVLIGAYVKLHAACPNQGVPYDASLTSFVEQIHYDVRQNLPASRRVSPHRHQLCGPLDRLPFREDVADRRAEVAAEAAESAGQPAPTPPELPSNDVTTLLKSAGNLFDDLTSRGNVGLPGGQHTAVSTALFSAAVAAAHSENYEQLDALLWSLRVQLRRPPTYFWQVTPWRLIEVFWWALMATVIRLILNSGRYVWSQRFLWRAISSHVALMAAVPLLALLISLVVEMLAVRIQIGSAAALDSSDVKTAILIASFVGFSPWKAWEFLASIGDRFFAWLARSTSDEERSGDSPQRAPAIVPPPAVTQTAPAVEVVTEPKQGEESAPTGAPEEELP